MFRPYAQHMQTDESRQAKRGEECDPESQWSLNSEPQLSQYGLLMAHTQKKGPFRSSDAKNSAFFWFHFSGHEAWGAKTAYYFWHYQDNSDSEKWDN